MTINATPDQTETLQIHLLGDFCVCIGEKSIEANHWKLRKAKTLIKLLALAPHHRLHREKLMDLLWPETDLQAATDSLHQTLHSLRGNLKPYCSNPRRYIQFEKELVSLCPDTQIWIDVEAFEAAAKEATRSRDSESYQVALALYTGDLLLEDRYEEWAISRREELRQKYIHLLFELGKLFESREEFPPAIDAFRKILVNDPLQEEAHTSLMHAYALVGQRPQALNQYRTLQEVLQKELGAEPDLQSTLLYQEILSGRLPASKIVPRSYTQPSPRHNLPRSLSTFVGREKEIEQVKVLTTSSRLVTLTGSGGVGKTSLAIRVAEALLIDYIDGVWLVELDSLSKEQLVPYAVAGVFGVSEDQDGTVLENLMESLCTKILMVVLDNCEHLVEACARLVEALLQACPNLHILTTSREALGIKGEILYQVPTLSFPEASILPDVSALTQFEAVRLFVETAQSMQPAFKITEENAPSIVQICQQLDGIPLALELAAARTRLLSAEQIAARLDDRFRLLTGGSRTTLRRQQTLLASIEWSYDLLSEGEQALFRRLSVFAGGWDLAAAEGVCADSALLQANILDLLSQLVNKSLVVVGSGSGHEPRYRLLETIRQYAAAKIAGTEEWVNLRNRHLAYFLHLVEEIEPKLRTVEQVERMKQLRAELDNLRSALSWSLVEPQGSLSAEGLRMASVLLGFWEYYGLISEGYEWLKKGLESTNQGEMLSTTLQAKALCAFGVINHDLHTGAHTQILEKSVSLYRKSGDKGGLSQALCRLVASVSHSSTDELKKYHPLVDEALNLARESGDSDILASVLLIKSTISENKKAAKAFAEESLILCQEKGNTWRIIDALDRLGHLSRSLGDYETALGYSEEMLQLARESEHKIGIADAYVLMGFSAYSQNDFNRMAASFQEALALFRELGLKGGAIFSLRQWGIAAKRQQNYHRAAACLMETLPLIEKIEDVHGKIMTLGLMAGIAAETGQLHRAALLLGAEEVQLESADMVLDSIEQAECDRDTLSVRSQLSKELFKAAWSEGRKMTLKQAVAEMFAIGAELIPS
jgi:predicted ATPase/DNA-binding SARP family transcriptional activator